MTSLPEDFTTAQFRDRKWRGENVAFCPDIAKEPNSRNRRCTDVVWCFIFLTFIAGMIWATIYGYSNGSPGKLVAPIDGDRKICGYTPGYEDYTMLYVDNLVNASDDPTHVFDYAVCVKACPVLASDTISCMPTQKVTAC